MFQKFILSICCLFFLNSCGTKDEPGNGNSGELPVVSLDALSILEGNEDKSVFISARLSKASEEVVTIFVESTDGTAEAGSDYEAISTAIDFEPGVIQANIRVNLLGDEESEVNESFEINITNVSGATIGTRSISVIIENDDAGNGSVVIPNTGFSTPESYDGMTLLWSDEFDGEQLNSEFWTHEIGNGEWGWGNNELQFYRTDNTSIVDGNLVIEARNEFFNGFQYTSSRFITKEKFEFTHGRVDIRARLPEGQGIWPALWMLGENINTVGWPRCGEIDIMEIVGHEPNILHGTVHYANPNGDRIQNGNDTRLTGGKKFSDEYYVFSLEWEEDSIRWYLNNEQYHSVSRGSLGLSNPYPFNEPFFFIFNVAVGGVWPGSPDDSTVFPQHMIVDYIRVFQAE